MSKTELARFKSVKANQTKYGIGRVIRKQVTAERLLTCITMISLLLLWLIVTELKLFTDVVVPSPQKVLRSFWEIAHNGYKENSLLRHLGDSMIRLLGSFLLVLITAIPLGLISGYNSKIRAIFDPLIEFYRPLPPLAYYTLLVLWMGIDNASKIALLYLAGFAPVYIACMSGVKKIRPDYIRGAYTLGASSRQVFFHVVFPACLPDIFVGLRTALGVAYTTLVAAEMVAAVTGIGWMVLDASKFLKSEVIFVGIFIMGITGVFLDQVIRRIESKVVPWKGQE
ncbi:ABC transporter permease subunit|uniref:Taurine transport system permease protein n=1 Tax=Dendrosporobacter quercicolus TaxID=146817 RepID=A0A1G9YPC7_9FIRM|nr:ABC transporter permease subunit [Dendrosporobacter quercicolus]NSL49825.1 ABC transporter permease subunit [Dendrosporobacter quercicolus DSM 1736]SDN10421.1 taurine transport system permease protein [Dendrosporobacter quercicolus]